MVTLYLIYATRFLRGAVKQRTIKQIAPFELPHQIPLGNNRLSDELSIFSLSRAKQKLRWSYLGSVLSWQRRMTIICSGDMWVHVCVCAIFINRRRQFWRCDNEETLVNLHKKERHYLFYFNEKSKSFKWRLSLKPQQYPFVQQIDVTIIVCFCYAMIIFVAHAKPREKTSGVDYWIDNNVWVNHRSVPNGPEQMFALLKKPWHCCARFPWNPIPVMCRRLFVMRKTVWFIYYFCLLSIICGKILYI